LLWLVLLRLRVLLLCRLLLRLQLLLRGLRGRARLEWKVREQRQLHARNLEVPRCECRVHSCLLHQESGVVQLELSGDSFAVSNLRDGIGASRLLRGASACLERCSRLVERVDRDLRIERRKLSHLLKTCARLGEIRLC